MVLGVVAYGSLYPFRFVPASEVVPRLVALFTSFEPGRSLGDVLGNIALFFPIGLLALARGGAERPRRLDLALVAGLGAGFGLALQLGQVFVRGRVPALDDALWNACGTLLGGLAAARLPAGFTLRASHSRLSGFPALLAASWLAYRLFPLVPSLDWQSFKDALKPLLLHPRLDLVDALRSGMGWLLFGALWEASPLGSLRQLPWLAVVPLTMAGEVLVVDNALTVSNVAGALAAIVAWRALRGRPRRDVWLAAALLLAIVAFELEPFHLAEAAGRFHWTPFYGFLEGSLVVAVQQLALKVYLYGGAIWLLARLGVSTVWATASVASMLFVLELAQIWIPGRTAEVSDALLVLLAGALAASVDAATR